MLLQIDWVNVCTWVQYVVSIQNCYIHYPLWKVMSNLELICEQSSSLKRLLTRDANSDLVKVSINFYIRFGARLLCDYTSHICARITLIHGFIGF